jgi:hypothetical protein
MDKYPTARFKVGDKFREIGSVAIRTVTEAHYSPINKVTKGWSYVVGIIGWRKEAELISNYEHLDTAEKLQVAQAELEKANDQYSRLL